MVLTIILILGIFSTLALLIGALLLHHYEQPMTVWLLLSVTSGCLTYGAYLGFSVGIGQWMLASTMGLLCLISLVKYWDIMQFTQ